MLVTEGMKEIELDCYDNQHGSQCHVSCQQQQLCWLPIYVIRSREMSRQCVELERLTTLGPKTAAGPIRGSPANPVERHGVCSELLDAPPSTA